MKKLYDAADRFCARHPRFGIPDLMRWIVIGNVVVYVLMLLTMRTDANAVSFLYLNGSKVLTGSSGASSPLFSSPPAPVPSDWPSACIFTTGSVRPWSASGAPPASTSITGAACF